MTTHLHVTIITKHTPKPKAISAMHRSDSIRIPQSELSHAVPSLPHACTSATTGHATQLEIYKGVSQTTARDGQKAKHYSAKQSSVGW
jgi:hypothetical protein